MEASPTCEASAPNVERIFHQICLENKDDATMHVVDRFRLLISKEAVFRGIQSMTLVPVCYLEAPPNC